MRYLSKALTAAVLALTATVASAAYPERPITLLVPWGAGGGTDATARIIGSLLEEELGQPVNVVNRTGGSGVVGHSAIANAKPDGYTLGVITVEIGMMHWQGLTDLDYQAYTPLILYNFDPAGLQVSADSDWDSAQALVDDIKGKDAGTYKASGTGQGGIWHLALAGMLVQLDMEPGRVPWVPSQGAASGLQDLVAGGVDIVPSSLPEAQALIEAGRVKSLAVMNDERNPAFPDVPTLQEAIGLDWSMGAWRGVAAPKGLPQEITDTLITALTNVYESEAFDEFMSQRGFGRQFATGEEFAEHMKQNDAQFGEVMKAAGLAR